MNDDGIKIGNIDEMTIDDIKADMKHMIDECVEQYVGNEKTISSDK